MKIKLEIDLKDLLEEEVDSYESDCGETLYRLKDNSEIARDLKRLIAEEISFRIKCEVETGFNYSINEELKNVVNENKQFIIDSIIAKVSKSIHNTKLIKDFKKGLDE